MPTTMQKDPASHLDYRFDWSAWMSEGDAISSVMVTAAPGLIETAETHDDTTVTVWLAGGEARTDYTVTCQITTTDGRTDERSLKIQVRER